MIRHDEAQLIDRLPSEIWQQIFAYVYPPFHLRYTQTHDHLPQLVWETVLENFSLYDLSSLPLMHELPRLGPLLVCRRFRDVGSEILTRAFTRDVHIVGRMIFKTVHHSYAGLMALTKHVFIAEEFLWTFLSLNFRGKMPNLERLTVLLKFMTCQSLSYEIVSDMVMVKTINRDNEKWIDARSDFLFDQLGGVTSITHSLRNKWEDVGIKTTYRYIHYATVQSGKITEARDLLLLDFGEDEQGRVELRDTNLFTKVQVARLYGNLMTRGI